MKHVTHFMSTSAWAVFKCKTHTFYDHRGSENNNCTMMVYYTSFVYTAVNFNNTYFLCINSVSKLYSNHKPLCYVLKTCNWGSTIKIGRRQTAALTLSSKTECVECCFGRPNCNEYYKEPTCPDFGLWNSVFELN